MSLKACRVRGDSYSRGDMAWYYAFNNEQKGPVEQSELEGLVQQGVVTPTTLVWREGMANWQRYGEIMPAGVVPGGAAVGAAVTQGGPANPTVRASDQYAFVVCAECGRAFSANEVIQIAGRNVCGACKPVAVQKLREGVATESDAERIRKEHIKHEASVKSVGILYFLGGGLLLLTGVLNLTMGVASQERALSLGLGVVLLALAGVQIWAGIGLRQLRPWARIVSGILSGIGLIVFPIGTIINGYILYLLFSQKGTTIFSDGYQDVIQQTPQIKYRTSVVVWVLLALLLALIFVAMVGVYIGTSRHAH